MVPLGPLDLYAAGASIVIMDAASAVACLAMCSSHRADGLGVVPQAFRWLVRGEEEQAVHWTAPCGEKSLLFLWWPCLPSGWILGLDDNFWRMCCDDSGFFYCNPLIILTHLVQFCVQFRCQERRISTTTARDLRGVYEPACHSNYKYR